jgi:hypothetical protein
MQDLPQSGNAAGRVVWSRHDAGIQFDLACRIRNPANANRRVLNIVFGGPDSLLDGIEHRTGLAGDREYQMASRSMVAVSPRRQVSG